MSSSLCFNARFWNGMGVDHLSSEAGCWQVCYFLEGSELSNGDQFINGQEVDYHVEDVLHRDMAGHVMTPCESTHLSGTVMMELLEFLHSWGCDGPAATSS